MQKGDKDFDNIFRDKLSDLSSEFNPSDWIMMERRLQMEGLTQDHEETDETRFDEVALDKLQNLSALSMTPDWDRMSQMIDEMNEEPSMEPSEFDQAVSNQIKDTRLPLDMTVWDQMEPTLDADRAAIVSDLDEVAKHKLTQISEIEPAWGTMNSKINRELFLPESIVKYKIVEVALILLFAFSASQLPISEIKDNLTQAPEIEITTAPAPEELATIANPIPREPAAQSELPTVSEDVVKGPAEEISLVSAVDINSVTEDSGIDAKLDEQEAATVENSTMYWGQPPSILELLQQLQDKSELGITEMVFNQVLDPVEFPDYSQMYSFLSLSDGQEGNKVLGKLEDEGSWTELSNTNITDAPGIESIAMNEVGHAIPKLIVNSDNLSKENNRIGLVLGMFTGSDYNEIITPFDKVYAQEGTTQWNLGYGGGFSLGMKFRNWELETGAIYSSNQYQPRALYDIHSGNISTGYVASTLRDIELELVKVPLNFRFNVNLWDKWNVYALSGATLNMVIQSEFITDDVILGSKTLARPTNPSFQNASLSLKDFGEGILEGGSFRDNSFFTANVGLGVERLLNNRWSVFAQPTYSRQIFSNGIGPNQDRFNAVSLFLGTRVALSNKRDRKK